MDQTPFALLQHQVSTLRHEILAELQKIHSLLQGPSAIAQKEYLSRKEVAQLFNLSLATLHNYMKTGELPYLKVGRKTVFKPAEVRRFFENRQAH